MKARYLYLRTPDRRSYSGEYTYVQKKLLLLQMPTTRPISTRVLIGRVVGICSNPIWHGEGGNGAGFLDYACINIEYLVCALAVASRAKEYSWECSGAHCICDGWVSVGFKVGAKGGFAVFLKVKFAAKDDLPRGVLVGYPDGCWEAIEP